LIAKNLDVEGFIFIFIINIYFFVKGEKNQLHQTIACSVGIVQFCGCISWLWLPRAKPRPLVQDWSSPSHWPNQT